MGTEELPGGECSSWLVPVHQPFLSTVAGGQSQWLVLRCCVSVPQCLRHLVESQESWGLSR